MKSLSHVRRVGLIVSVAALMPLTDAVAQLWDPLPPAERECVIPDGNKSVQIVAGEAGAAFPKVVTNTPDQLCTGTCHQWDYTFYYFGFNGSQSLVSIDSAVKLIDSPDNPVLIFPPEPGDPTPLDASIEFGNVAGELGMRFNHNGAVYQARFYTDTATAVGTVTAGFKSGGRNGFCAIAGAVSVPGKDPLMSVPTAFITKTLDCDVKWEQTPDGCVSSAEILPGSPLGCEIVERDAVVGDGNVLSAACGSEVAGKFGSTDSCQWSSILRRFFCVSVP